jgi:hypothetical protein
MFVACVLDSKPSEDNATGGYGDRRNVLPTRNRIGEMLAIVGEPANQARPLHALRISTRTCLSDEGKLDLYISMMRTNIVDGFHMNS